MKAIFKHWKIFAVRLANFQIKLLLLVIYFILILPYAAFFALSRMIPAQKKNTATCWAEIPKKIDTIEDLRRQF